MIVLLLISILSSAISIASLGLEAQMLSIGTNIVIMNGYLITRNVNDRAVWVLSFLIYLIYSVAYVTTLNFFVYYNYFFKSEFVGLVFLADSFRDVSIKDIGRIYSYVFILGVAINIVTAVYGLRRSTLTKLRVNINVDGVKLFVVGVSLFMISASLRKFFTLSGDSGVILPYGLGGLITIVNTHLSVAICVGGLYVMAEENSKRLRFAAFGYILIGLLGYYLFHSKSFIIVAIGSLFVVQYITRKNIINRAWLFTIISTFIFIYPYLNAYRSVASMNANMSFIHTIQQAIDLRDFADFSDILIFALGAIWQRVVGIEPVLVLAENIDLVKGFSMLDILSVSADYVFVKEIFGYDFVMGYDAGFVGRFLVFSQNEFWFGLYSLLVLTIIYEMLMLCRYLRLPSLIPFVLIHCSLLFMSGVRTLYLEFLLFTILAAYFIFKLVGRRNG